jgi:enoyl-CoA hydratase/carnithine racemase
MIDIARLTIPASRLWPGEAPWDAPLAIVDLASAGEAPATLSLPLCPVIGTGDPAHPLAVGLDAVVEPPISLDAVVHGVLARPAAAAVTVQLLRLLPRLSAEDGLVAESMAYGLLQGSAEHRAWLASEHRPARTNEGAVAIRLEGNGLTVELVDPLHGNAIDRPMRDALHEAFGLAALDPEIIEVRLRAAGRSFSLGAELSEFGTTADPASAHAIRGLTLPARAAARCADKLDVHVQGACVGAGLELAAWGRRVTASPDAWFQLPELAMGVLPGAGGCVSLTRRIGRQRAGLLILSGKRVNARTALDWGLIDALVDSATADEGGADVG